MSIEVKVKRSGTAGTIRAFIDDKVLKFDDDGNASRDCEEGKHTFSWLIEGSAKQTYNVRIVVPQRVATGAKGEIKNQGRIVGSHRFDL